MLRTGLLALARRVAHPARTAAATAAAFAVRAPARRAAVVALRPPTEVSLRRGAASSAAPPPPGERSDASNWAGLDYHAVAEETVMYVQEQVEKALDATDVNCDMDYANGVLTVRLPRGTFVLNKQAPLKELWYSSPISGPSHYVLRRGYGWVGKRDGAPLFPRIAAEMKEAAGADVDLASFDAES